MGAGYCSRACYRDAVDDLAGFRPDAPRSDTERWADGWRLVRAAFEIERAGVTA